MKGNERWSLCGLFSKSTIKSPDMFMTCFTEGKQLAEVTNSVPSTDRHLKLQFLSTF